MSAPALLRTLFNYQAWAHDELLDRMEAFDPAVHADARHAAIRLVNHCLVVNQIFAAHLVGRKHDFSADNTEHTPTLKDLRKAVTALDRWYLDYLETMTPELLAERVPFVFTDGDKGFMSREEMLAHVATHGGYHRGEVGRLMRQQSLPLPWDTFAVYLHQAEPSRRLQGTETAPTAQAA
ncbi:DinB family protein [Variovorax sp. EL159]|uniref:DinB family protein n=1 Tax=Variovorax sp. EL159 TaxID=1566270 RepID=UPI000886EA17|nr:DinB family protein [Variovorax sp. EL159]SCX65141.1 Uncharacterized damage-inducible protein DinB (forms a four-helix bundle) [Variovorax sp. EL159]